MKNKNNNSEKFANNLTEEYESILPGIFKKHDETRKKLYMQSMIAIVLEVMNYKFESVPANSFAGVLVLTNSCDELLEERRNQRHQFARQYKGLEKWEETILLDITILLSVLYAEIFYLLEENGYPLSYGQSETIESFYMDLMRLKRNREIYSKLVGLSRLIEPDTEVEEMEFIQNFSEFFDVFLLAVEAPGARAAAKSLIQLFMKGEKASVALISHLIKSNAGKLMFADSNLLDVYEKVSASN